MSKSWTPFQASNEPEIPAVKVTIKVLPDQFGKIIREGNLPAIATKTTLGSSGNVNAHRRHSTLLNRKNQCGTARKILSEPQIRKNGLDLDHRQCLGIAT